MPNSSTYSYDVPEVIPTDPVLEDLIPEFIEQWQKDLTVTWSDVKERRDMEEFKRFGHTIKGSFLQFGFSDLSAVGKQIMVDAENGDWDEAGARVLGIYNVLAVLKQRL